MDVKSFWMTSPSPSVYSPVDLSAVPSISPTAEPSAGIDVTIDEVYTVIVVNSFFLVFLLYLHYRLAKSLQPLYVGRNFHVSESLRVQAFDLNKFLSWMFDDWSFEEIRNKAGLDAYMFMRFLRICLVITSVASFYGLLVLWPVYYTGNQDGEEWYVLSMQNVDDGSPRLWAGSVFMWVLTLFVIWNLKREMDHYTDLRLEFGGCVEGDMDAVHLYSVIVERLPKELQDDKALKDYFEEIFPGKVEHAGVIINYPELERVFKERQTTVEKLEKAFAIYQSTSIRPTHRIGGWQWGDICCFHKKTQTRESTVQPLLEDNDYNVGDEVDSIQFYETKLEKLNEEVRVLQQRAKLRENDVDLSKKSAQCWIKKTLKFLPKYEQEKSGDKDATTADDESSFLSTLEQIDSEQESLIDTSDYEKDLISAVNRRRPGQKYDNLSRWQWLSGILGKDFTYDLFKFLRKQIDDFGSESFKSSTGFVTFNSLVTTTIAVDSSCTHHEGLIINRAPEPRDIIWRNIAVDHAYSEKKKSSAVVIVAFGALLWAIPIAFIQAIATADTLSEVDGFEWLSESNNSALASFVNGYLPVVTIMGLILLLPLVFEFIGKSYEFRKTKSGLETSVMNRMFVYLLANIFVTVTSGSLWDSLNDIIDEPSDTFEILGDSLPEVVGYFVSFVITKILLGLPSTLMRWGALSRYIWLRIIYSEESMTQRELDIIYREQVIRFGREYPNLLLVSGICFTYACIAPVVLPAGAVYFWFAFFIYKMQFLHLYSPRYESGGLMFPDICRLLLVGLIGGQITLIGYLSLREGYQPAAFVFLLIPVTLSSISDLKNRGRKAKNLSLEIAAAFDKNKTKIEFDDDAYKQKIMKEADVHPLPYRRENGSLEDAITTANENQD